MRHALVATILGAAGLLAVPACAHTPYWESPGSLVSVSVEVEGRAAPLYPAPDGSGRFYLEAREGSRYSVTIANRTYERLGVILTVDGLNAISGDRDRAGAGSPPLGRMYVLDPWGAASVKGWRTSLADVRRFTFVDERASYAARSGKANSRMGWIELAVYRERPRPYVSQPGPVYRTDPYDESGARDESAKRSAEEQADNAAKAERDDDRDRPSASAREGALARQAPPATTPAPTGGYPGTGWGAREDDRAMLVDFEPQAAAAERITLRYEYASALYALGILPAPWPARDRLRERETGELGFARPPRW